MESLNTSLLLCAHCNNILDIQKINISKDKLSFLCPICDKLTNFNTMILIEKEKKEQSLTTDSNLLDNYIDDPSVYSLNIKCYKCNKIVNCKTIINNKMHYLLKCIECGHIFMAY